MNSTPKRPSTGPDLSASELYCPKCRAARPVDERLALFLAKGILYQYACRTCQEIIGTKIGNGHL